MGSCVVSTKMPSPTIVQKTLPSNSQPQSQLTRMLRERGSGKQKPQALVDSRLKSLDITDASSAVIVDKEKQSKDIRLIESSLNKHFIFNTLTDEQRALVISQMKLYILTAGALVFEQDQPGNNFFIIAAGRVEVLVNQKRKAILKPGDSFGELALLHGTYRSATIRTLERCSMWSVDRGAFRQVVQSLNSMYYKENKEFLQNIPIFRALNELQQEALVTSVTTQKFPPGIRIFNDGEPGELFYLIKEGKVAVVKHGEEIRKMGKGDYFGEQALLYDQNRTATISCISEVICLVIGRDALNLALGEHLQDIIYKNSLKIALEKDEITSKLSPTQIDSVIDKIKVVAFAKGEVVLRAGTETGTETGTSEDVFVVVKGSLTSSEHSYDLFACINSTCLLKKSQFVITDNIIAYEKSDVAVISLREFEEAIGGDFATISSKNEIFSTLKHVPILSTLTSTDLTKIMEKMTILVFEAGTTIVQENDPGDSFFIIRTGEVDVYRGSTQLRSLNKFDYFGERSLLFNNPRSATILSKTNVECWCLQRNDFLGIFTEPARVQLLRRIDLQDDSILLEELALVKLIGKGMFGNVFLTAHKSKKSCYALKCISRKKIEAYQIHSNVLLERKVLLLLDHPMIMKLVKTFKDQYRVYFLIELVVGLDLFDMLRKINHLTDLDSRFYTACLITVLEHLHSRDIVYRDLKPENIVIDTEGYPKLIDFGISKIVRGRTFTMVGTPHYMPPEVISGKGYGVAADYWSLGIMLYEFLAGAVPFGDDEEEPYAIYEKVIARKIAYPLWIEAKMPVRNVIEQLLSKNPYLRTGGSVQNLKGNPWFTGVNWEKLLIKQVKAPHIPDIKDSSLEISEALENGKSLLDSILGEESKDRFTKRVSKHILEGDENWDAEF